MRLRSILLVATCFAFANGAATSHAFQIETSVTGGCHESLTQAAIDVTGWDSLTAEQAPPALQSTLADAANDLTFTLLPQARNQWNLALLIGVRSPDIQDNSPTDVASLVHIHNDPVDQPAHCIRREQDDGANGDVDGLAACRSFIEQELMTGGWFEPVIDTTRTEPVALYLAFRGRVTLQLPSFAYRLGRALHALEDGYTHAFRNPNTDEVRHLLNWIDSVSDEYNEGRDGHPHLGPLDDCRRDHAGQINRINRVSTAVQRLISAVVAAGTPSERIDRVKQALDASFRIEPGCSAANRYCSAPELDEASGCRSSTGAGPALAAILALLLIARRKRKALALAAVLCVGVVGFPAAAQAERATVIDARFGGSLDRGGAAFMVGAGRTRGAWTAGAVAEWNPWFSLDTVTVVAGTANLYGTLTRRWYKNEAFSLYSRLEIGGSVILTRLVGVEPGNAGFYFGGSLLGIAVQMSPKLSLTFDPSHFAAPAPQITGLPFYYRQYRISVGLRWTFDCP